MTEAPYAHWLYTIGALKDARGRLALRGNEWRYMYW